MSYTKSNRKTVLIITSSFPASNKKDEMMGGFVMKLAEGLIKYNRVLVLTPHSKGLAKIENWDGIEVYRNPITPFGDFGLFYGDGILPNLQKKPYLFAILPLVFISQIFAIKKLTKENHIDVINPHWLYPSGLSTIIFKKIFNPNVNVILTIHGSDLNRLTLAFFEYLDRLILKNCNYVSTVNSYLKKKILKLHDKALVEVCPMGVDRSVFKPVNNIEDLKESLDLSLNSNIIIFVGSIIQAKGILDLINSMPKVLEKYPDTILFVAGEGQLRETAQKKCENLCITNNVRFLGLVPNNNLPKYLAVSDFLVLPSYSEGWPVVMMEALSCGCPVLVSDLPQFNDTDQTDKCIFTFSKGNVDELADKITYLMDLKASNKLQEIKQDSIIYAKEEFDINKVSEKYQRIICTI